MRLSVRCDTCWAATDLAFNGQTPPEHPERKPERRFSAVGSPRVVGSAEIPALGRVARGSLFPGRVLRYRSQDSRAQLQNAKEIPKMVRMLAAATLGVLVLGGGVVSYVHASKDCNPNACAAIIDAECGGFSGKV